MTLQVVLLLLLRLVMRRWRPKVSDTRVDRQLALMRRRSADRAVSATEMRRCRELGRDDGRRRRGEREWCRSMITRRRIINGGPPVAVTALVEGADAVWRMVNYRGRSSRRLVETVHVVGRPEGPAERHRRGSRRWGWSLEVRRGRRTAADVRLVSVGTPEVVHSGRSATGVDTERGRRRRAVERHRTATVAVSISDIAGDRAAAEQPTGSHGVDAERR